MCKRAAIPAAARPAADGVGRRRRGRCSREPAPIPRRRSAGARRAGSPRGTPRSPLRRDRPPVVRFRARTRAKDRAARARSPPRAPPRLAPARRCVLAPWPSRAAARPHRGARGRPVRTRRTPPPVRHRPSSRSARPSIASGSGSPPGKAARSSRPRPSSTRSAVVSGSRPRIRCAARQVAVAQIRRARAPSFSRQRASTRQTLKAATTACSPSSASPGPASLGSRSRRLARRWAASATGSRRSSSRRDASPRTVSIAVSSSAAGPVGRTIGSAFARGGVICDRRVRTRSSCTISPPTRWSGRSTNSSTIRTMALVVTPSAGTWTSAVFQPAAAAFRSPRQKAAALVSAIASIDRLANTSLRRPRSSRLLGTSILSTTIPIRRVSATIDQPTTNNRATTASLTVTPRRPSRKGPSRARLRARTRPSRRGCTSSAARPAEGGSKRAGASSRRFMAAPRADRRASANRQ